MFRHRVHVGVLGLDCRYCHNTVERSGVAAVPPAATCMTCHRLVLGADPRLARVREAVDQGGRLEWARVHLLPDYSYFDHRAHLAAGVGCVECHGRIDQMDVVYQAEPLSMSWCLECHRAPTRRLRPRSEITNMTYSGPRGPDPALGRRLDPPLHCSGCHR